MELGHDENDPTADALMALTLNRLLTPEEINALLAIDGIDQVMQATL